MQITDSEHHKETLPERRSGEACIETDCSIIKNSEDGIVFLKGRAGAAEQTKRGTE